MSGHSAENDATCPPAASHTCGECRRVPNITGSLDGYRPRKPLPEYAYDEYAERGDPR